MSTYSYVSGMGYANRYNTLQNQHLEQLKAEILGQTNDIAERNKKMSAETNKRRRELINKKKQRENSEEQRRAAILADRRAKLQEATTRYQHGAAPKINTSHYRRTSPSPRYRASSAPTSRPSQIDLESALKLIRGTNSIQFNPGESGSNFIQKYGAYRQIQQNGHHHTDGTNKHSKSVTNNQTDETSRFESELINGQAVLNHNASTMQSFHRQLHKELGVPPSNVNNNNFTHNEDVESVTSMDSLESEQPTNRSQLNSSRQTSTVNDDAGSGSGTYRQESPSVLHKTDDRTKRVQSAPVNRSRVMVPEEAKPQVAFQVVERPKSVTVNQLQQEAAVKPQKPVPRKPNTNNAETSPSKQVHPVREQAQPLREQSNPAELKRRIETLEELDKRLKDDQKKTSSHSVLINETLQEAPIALNRSHSLPTNNTHATTNDNTQFYLKSRSEPQRVVENFPPPAWTIPIDLPAHDSITPHPPSDTSSHRSMFARPDPNIAEESEFIQERPRGILKRTGSKMSRSRSTPSIRDSLDIHKGHYKDDTPKSEKKSVRFADKHMEAHQHTNNDMRSRSGIPVSIQSLQLQSKTNKQFKNNKTAAGSIKRGPVIADHDIKLHNQYNHESSRTPTSSSTHHLTSSSHPAAAGHPGSGGQQAAALTVNNIRLDKTPTDEEIEMLWDKVRLCLNSPNPGDSARSIASVPVNQVNRNSPVNQAYRASPADSVRSAPEYSHSRRPHVKKITSSDINQIGRAQSMALPGQTTQLLQRQRQEPKVVYNTLTGNPHQTVGNSNQLAGNPHQSVSSPANETMVPNNSNNEPHQSNSINTMPPDVSESMAAFLTAEQLAENSDLSESRILQAMTDAQYRQELSANGRPTVPLTALSMEEQRLLQSLDRLNTKLKEIQDRPDQESSQRGGFKGHRPLQNRGRSTSTDGVKVNSGQFRLY